jgi:hypothetical protein
MTPRGIVMAVQMWPVDETTSAFQNLWSVGGFFNVRSIALTPTPRSPGFFFGSRIF